MTSPIVFASPSYLLLLPPLLLLVALWGRRSLAGLERWRRRLAWALRVSVVTLLVLALAEVEWRDLTQRVEVVFVVDRSQSIPEAKANEALALVNAAQARMGSTNDLGRVVVFGANAATEVQLRPDGAPLTELRSVVRREHTDIERGLLQALDSFSPDVRGRIVLLSDGSETLGKASDAATKIRAQRIPIDVIPIEYDYAREVLVEKLVVDEEAKVGEPFLARVVMSAQAPTPARVTLYQGDTALRSREVTLQPGPNVEQFELVLESPEFFRLRAVVEPLDKADDQLYQNNAAHAFVFARGQSHVLYVGADSESGYFLRQALGREQVRIAVAQPRDVPTEALDLQRYHAVILDNVERSRFTERQQQALETAVNKQGVGLVMIGGEDSFGAGDWRGSPVETALPVNMEIKQEEVIPDGALVMIIHSCELPEGNAAAVKVCKRAVDGLSGKDQVGVLVYDPMAGATWAVPFRQARNKPAIKRQIDNMAFGDMPDFKAIFRQALLKLQNAQAGVKHMILMSDGDPSPPDAAMLNACVQNKITVSTICYGAHGGPNGPDTFTMKRIARLTGGKYYYVNSVKQLPRIFMKESQRVSRPLIVEKTFVPLVRGRSPVLNGIDSSPPLHGHVLTEPKPTATVALVSPENAPILAHWQHGVGRSLAFTSDATSRWAADWVQWGGYQSFWAQALRWVSKEVQDTTLAPSTRVEGDRGKIALDAISPDGELIDGLRVTAKVTTPDGRQELELPLTQRGAGRYEGDFPIAGIGTYNVHLVSRSEDGEREHTLTTGLVVPYSEEFKRLESDRPFLEELARQAGGEVVDPARVLSGEHDFWDRARLDERVALERRWAWVLTVAVFLFLLDVAVRRVAIDFGKLLAKLGAFFPKRRPPSTPGATMDRLQRVREQVRQEQTGPNAAAPKKFVDTGAPGPQVTVAGGEPPAPPSGGAAPQPPGPPHAPGDDAKDKDKYSRLLQAKKRARKEFEQDP
ncbi:MAG: VWA domain-containing protein [Planctomycetes bacterium]|nr:VWA domain-containing protein [Planctomycetota bacterium]